LNDNNSQSDKILLRVAETDPKFVGKGIAVIDPKVMEDLNLGTGDVVEISGNRRNTHALLWSSQVSDSGRKLIRIDGYTRNNLGVGIDDNVSIKSVRAAKVEQIILSPTQDLNVVGLEEHLPDLLEGHVVTKGDTIPINIMGHKIGFIVTTIIPSNGPAIVTANTDFVIGSVPKQESRSIPRVNYEDIGGLRNEIQKVREMIELPMRHPEIFDSIGIDAPRGVLLFGPPGTGKTLLAKAVANETNANFYSIGGPEIMSKFYGESEERLRDTFKQAQENSPSIIFIDELDAVAPKRSTSGGDSHVGERIVSQLLTEMDGLEDLKGVVVIGATNRPDIIDEALLRPGRFDRLLEIPLPNSDAIKEIIKIHMAKKPMDKSVDVDKLVGLAKGYSGADIAALVNAAAMSAIKEYITINRTAQAPIKKEVEAKTGPESNNAPLLISMRHFENALKKIRKNVTMTNINTNLA